MKDEIEDPNLRLAINILPAWFVERMMTDSWHFGLMLINGKTIAIESIDRISLGADDSVWIDAFMSDLNSISVYRHAFKKEGIEIIATPIERKRITINAAHIVAAFEIADT